MAVPNGPAISYDYLNFIRADSPDIGAYEFPHPEAPGVNKQYLYITGPMSVTEGTEVTLSVVLSNTLATQNDNDNLHLEWFHNGVKIIDNCNCDVYGQNICSCTYTPTTLNLTLNPVLMDNAGEYVLRSSFKGDYGRITYSPPFILSVNDAPTSEGECGDPALIDIRPTQVFFGDVPDGGYREEIVVITNLGCQILNGQAMITSGSSFEIHFKNEATYSIKPGEFHQIHVRISSTNATQGTMTLTGGDGGICTLYANMIGAPRILVQPNIIDFEQIELLPSARKTWLAWQLNQAQMPVMICLSEIYFEDKWKQSFPPKRTRYAHFKGNGSNNMFPMMCSGPSPGKLGSLYQKHLSHTSPFHAFIYTGSSFTVVKWDIVSVPDMVRDFWIIVPNNDLSDPCFTVEDIKTWLLGDYPFTPVNHLHIPRFTIHTKVSLKKSLSALGVVKPFIPGQIDFPGLVPDKDVYIHDIECGTTLNVNETGISSNIDANDDQSTRSGPFKCGQPDFVADRPFYFMLVDDDKIMLWGYVTNPNGTNDN